jgi:hypothetical protein
MLEMGATVGVITAAGCLGSGTEFEVVQNDLEESLEFSHDGVSQYPSDSEEPEGVVATGTIKNVSDRPVSMALSTSFYDGNDELLGVDNFGFLRTGIDDGESLEYEQVITETTDPDRVARVEFEVDER